MQEEIAVVLAAMGAGAAAGAGDVARTEVTGAFADFKALLGRHLRPGGTGPDPAQEYEERLGEILRELAAHLATREPSPELLRSARDVLAGSERAAQVTISGSQGVVVGDHANTTMTINMTPPPT